MSDAAGSAGPSLGAGGRGALRRIVDRTRSPYLRAVAAQGVVSAFHFALNLTLVRLVVPEQYGLFAFAFVLAMFASAVNNALIATPLTVWTPIIVDPVERAGRERMFGTLSVALSLALAAGGLAWTLAAGDGLAPVALGTTAFVSLYAARHYSRSTGYARMRPLVTAAGDLAYVVAGVTLAGALVLAVDAVPIGAVLCTLALANLVAMLVEHVGLHGTLPRPRLPPRREFEAYAEIWQQSRWALVGSLTTLFLAQAHSLIVTWVDGPGAFAPLAAGTVLFGPVRIALTTWQNMVKPELAVALHEGRLAEVRVRLRRANLATALAVLALGAGLALAWPHVHGFLYERRYSGAPMGTIVSIWCAVTLCAALYNVPSAALQALRDFRRLAMASLWGALVSGTAVGTLLFLTAPAYTLLGVLAAEAFMAVYLTRTLYASLERAEGRGADGRARGAVSVGTAGTGGAEGAGGAVRPAGAPS